MKELKTKKLYVPPRVRVVEINDSPIMLGIGSGTTKPEESDAKSNPHSDFQDEGSEWDTERDINVWK